MTIEEFTGEFDTHIYNIIRFNAVNIHIEVIVKITIFLT